MYMALSNPLPVCMTDCKMNHLEWLCQTRFSCQLFYSKHIRLAKTTTKNEWR